MAFSISHSVALIRRVSVCTNSIMVVSMFPTAAATSKPLRAYCFNEPTTKIHLKLIYEQVVNAKLPSMHGIRLPETVINSGC